MGEFKILSICVSRAGKHDLKSKNGPIYYYAEKWVYRHVVVFLKKKNCIVKYLAEGCIL